MGQLRVSLHESDSAAGVLLSDTPLDVGSGSRRGRRCVLDDWVEPELGGGNTGSFKSRDQVSLHKTVDGGAFHGHRAFSVQPWGV